MNMITDAAQPELAIATWEWGVFFGQEAKISGNYVNSPLAKTESKRNGFDEAIMLGPDGFISECTGENIFIVRGKQIFTPPKAAILEGITRASIFQIAEEIGYAVEEQQISRDQLYIADEIFVCGTAAEVVAIREVDYRRIGAGKMGPVTRAVQQAFESATRGKHRFSREWLSYVQARRQSRHAVTRIKAKSWLYLD
jgi:branched-chain amino acid aminotransferase